MHNQILPLLSKLIKDARRKAESSTVFRKSQMYVRRIYEKAVCQAFVALIIIGVSVLFANDLHIILDRVIH